MKAIPKIGFLLVAILLLAVGNLCAQQPRYESRFEPEEPDASPRRWSVSGKITYHTFWKQGLLDNGEEYGRPGLGVGSLTGVGGEIEFDYHMRPFIVFSGTVGGYQGKRISTRSTSSRDMPWPRRSSRRSLALQTITWAQASERISAV